MRVLLVVLAALISLGTLGGLGVLAVGIGSIRVVTDTRALPANVRLLTVDTGDVPAAVRITTDVNAKEPRVNARMVTGTNDTQLTVVNNDISSQVTVRDKGSRLLGRHNAGELKVILPPGVARELKVTVNQRRGTLSIDANLDQLVANTGGAVTLGGSTRRIGVNARRGDIRTSGPIAVTESFTADTEYGRISVEFRVAPRTTEAIAGGDVTVGLPVPGPYRVRAQSQGGQTTVTVQETSDSSAPEVMARSKGANVKVTELR